MCGNMVKTPTDAKFTPSPLLTNVGSHVSSMYSDQLLQKWATMMAHTAGCLRNAAIGGAVPGSPAGDECAWMYSRSVALIRGCSAGAAAVVVCHTPNQTTPT